MIKYSVNCIDYIVLFYVFKINIFYTHLFLLLKLQNYLYFRENIKLVRTKMLTLPKGGCTFHKAVKIMRQSAVSPGTKRKQSISEMCYPW